MNDQERDPVGWAQMQDAGRVGGNAAANDRVEVVVGEDTSFTMVGVEGVALEDYLATIPGKRAAELRRMFRESEAAARDEA